jgi:hypothetical protein
MEADHRLKGAFVRKLLTVGCGRAYMVAQQNGNMRSASPGRDRYQGCAVGERTGSRLPVLFLGIELAHVLAS